MTCSKSAKQLVNGLNNYLDGCLCKFKISRCVSKIYVN